MHVFNETLCLLELTAKFETFPGASIRKKHKRLHLQNFASLQSLVGRRRGSTQLHVSRVEHYVEYFYIELLLYLSIL